MTLRPTVAQPLDFNPFGWRAPYHRPRSGADYVEGTGLAAEDWNFDLTQRVGDHLYGYGQGKVSRKRRRDAPHGFDVLFYFREAGGTFRAVGLYLAAEYVEEDQAMEAWEELAAAGHVKKRRVQLGQALIEDPAKAKRAQRALDEGGHVRWKVHVDNIVIFEDQPVIEPKRDTDYHHVNAYDWTDHPWTHVVAPGPDAKDWEGGLVTVVHQVRERSSAFRAKVLALRKAKLAKGEALDCDVCGFDFGAWYGAKMLDFIEAHHTVPLHTFAAEGGRVKAEDIALLCPNCHRAAHRTGAWTVPEIVALIASPIAKRAPPKP